MGWQSWESVDEISLPEGNGNAGPSNTGGTEDALGDTDWWNVTATDKNIDYASLPLDIWNPLLPHKTGCVSFPR
jgi:hypothetical protein